MADRNAITIAGARDADDRGSSFRFCDECEDICKAVRYVERSRQLVSGLTTLDQGLAMNSSPIPLD
jgi:hypothetical protein